MLEWIIDEFKAWACKIMLLLSLILHHFGNVHDVELKAKGRVFCVSPHAEQVFLEPLPWDAASLQSADQAAPSLAHSQSSASCSCTFSAYN